MKSQPFYLFEETAFYIIVAKTGITFLSSTITQNSPKFDVLVVLYTISIYNILGMLLHAIGYLYDRIVSMAGYF